MAWSWTLTFELMQKNSHLVISGLQCQLIIQAEFVPCNLCDLSTPLRFWISAYSNLPLSALLFNLILQSLYFNHNGFQVFLIFQLENQQHISILITFSDSWNFWCILTAFNSRSSAVTSNPFNCQVLTFEYLWIQNILK